MMVLLLCFPVVVRYAQRACPCHFEEHNIFMPHVNLGTFDRIYAGARCTEDRLPILSRLLSPGGGIMVVPVESELRLISRCPGGGGGGGGGALL